jgi:hypothetical protein
VPAKVPLPALIRLVGAVLVGQPYFVT